LSPTARYGNGCSFLLRFVFNDLDHWFHKDNFERAFERDANARHNAENMIIWNVRRMWGGKAAPEKTEKARTVGDQFATRFPQFERSLSNAEKMVEYMESHDLDGTQLPGYITAFHALTETGELTLAPAQSAEEYLAQHAELHDNRIPPVIAARHQREQNTEARFAKSASATNQGSVTRVVDYGQQKHGVPPESEKYSFRMKVRSMSANELARRCADDPAFRAASDNLD
jgi:hypothetical protein